VHQRSPARVGALISAAVVLAGISAGIGGAVAVSVDHTHSAPSTLVTAAAGASKEPVANLPSGSVEQVAAEVAPSVVQLETRVGLQYDEGSGIILSSNGLIMTNAHVVSAPDTGGDRSSAQRVVTFGDGRTAPFSVVSADPVTDIAVVRAQGISGLIPITLGSATSLHVGEDVVAIGAPLGLAGTVTTGVVSALHRPVSALGGTTDQSTVLDAIQTDAAMNPGSSGGALVDMSGHLVGITSAIASLGDSLGVQSGSIGLGFAIPVDQAKRVADELISSGKASHASLGVQVSSDPTVHGAKITEVAPGGPAASAGLSSGMVVTKVDDQVVTNADALVAAVRTKAPGDKVTLTFVERTGTTRTAGVNLGNDQRT
jgi:putative serine protease PepD